MTVLRIIPPFHLNEILAHNKEFRMMILQCKNPYCINLCLSYLIAVGRYLLIYLWNYFSKVLCRWRIYKWWNFILKNRKFSRNPRRLVNVKYSDSFQREKNWILLTNFVSFITFLEIPRIYFSPLSPVSVLDVSYFFFELENLFSSQIHSSAIWSWWLRWGSHRGVVQIYWESGVSIGYLV